MTKALIIEATFYTDISDYLRQGATEYLAKKNISYDILTVPGALEIPAALSFAVQSPSHTYDFYVILGCVIRGETSHYDIVCNESARGVYDLTLKHNLALGNGILTVEDEEQAYERAEPNRMNKGAGAAQAAHHMFSIKKKYLG